MKFKIETYDARYYMLVDTIFSNELKQYHSLAFGVLRALSYTTYQQQDLNRLRAEFVGNVQKYKSYRVGDRAKLRDSGKQYTTYLNLFKTLGIDKPNTDNIKIPIRHYHDNGFTGIIQHIVPHPSIGIDKLIIHFSSGDQHCVCGHDGILENPKNVEIW